MRAVVVSGHPDPASHTADAGIRLAKMLGGSAPELIELGALGAELLTSDGERVRAAMRAVQSSEVAVFASPTFAGTYSGIMKLFLDRFVVGTGLRGVVGVPLMLGQSSAQSMAAELSLKPVLVHLGATCPAPGLFQLESRYRDEPALPAWLAVWRPVIRRSVVGSDSAGVLRADHGRRESPSRMNP